MISDLAVLGFVAGALLIIGVAIAVYVGIIILAANDLTHLHCANPEDDWS